MTKPLTTRLRIAIKRDGRSIYALAKASGLGIGPLQRFAAGAHGMTLDSADKLAEALGLTITLVPKKRRK